MKTIITLSVALMLAPLCAEEDIREKVRGEAKDKSSLIDPGQHIYGHPFGISEDDFIKAEGRPVGYAKLSGRMTVMIYGRSHGFIFTDGKLSGLRIASSILDWKLGNQSPYGGKRNDSSWKLSNGVHAGMTDTAVKALLGNKLAGEDYSPHFDIGGCRVELNFATYSSGENKGLKKICAIYINKK